MENSFLNKEKHKEDIINLKKYLYEINKIENKTPLTAEVETAKLMIPVIIKEYETLQKENPHYKTLEELEGLIQNKFLKNHTDILRTMNLLQNNNVHIQSGLLSPLTILIKNNISNIREKFSPTQKTDNNIKPK